MKHARLAIGLMIAAASTAAQATPTVVELFTSQGCSSCPPAEAYINELAARPGILALTFHVDYWDDLGWKDRFSSSDATLRQRNYAQALGLRSVYTPQVVIGGSRDFVGSHRSAIEGALKSASADLPLTLSLNHETVDVRLGAAGSVGESDVVVVAYLKSAITPIGRGENAGRTLQQSNIVRGMQRIGHWNGANQTWQFRVDQFPHDATDLAVIVQRRGQGSILGAAHLGIR